MRCLWGFILLGLLPLLAGAEARFLVPVDRKALFRRDLLPLETDTIRTLSRHLADLAACPLSPGDAAHNRAIAQLLTLSLQLDPVNQPARRLLKQHLRKEKPKAPSQERVERSKEGVQNIARWLLSPTSGNDGRRLGQLIVDPLRILHPDLPICQEAGPEGEAKRWRGSVPPVTAFMVRPDPPEGSFPKDGLAPNDSTTTTPPLSNATVPLQVSIRTPLYTTPPGRRTGYFLPTLSLSLDIKGTEEKNTPPRLFRLEPDCSRALESAVALRSVRGLSILGKPLPTNKVATFQTGTSAYLASNDQALSGPTALLLHAALSGQSLRSEVVLIGALDTEGQFQLPRLGWDYLRFSLPERPPVSGKLLVPVSAERQMRALLTIERPEFFLDWEVIGVQDLPQALAHACIDAPSESIREASALFAGFQKVAENQDLGPLSVNRLVRERMQQILSLNPNHLSAKMILLQGSGNRPKTLDQETLGLELMVLLDFLGSPLTTKDPEDLSPGQLEFLEKRCLSRLKLAEERAGAKNRSVLRRFRHSTNRLGQLARARRGADESELHDDRLREGFFALKKEHAKLSAEVQTLLGDRPVEPSFSREGLGR